MNYTDLDIRWKQRFDNLTRTKQQLDPIAFEIPERMKHVEIAGWIHIFDLVFELSWKTLRDYMISRGESEHLDFPRDVINNGTEKGFIDDGYLWIEMLTDRNSSTHEYDEQNALELIERIQKQYLPHITTFYEKLRAFAE